MPRRMLAAGITLACSVLIGTSILPSAAWWTQIGAGLLALLGGIVACLLLGIVLRDVQDGIHFLRDARTRKKIEGER